MASASTHPFSEGPWFCKHCHKPFSDWEDLIKHKQQRRNANKEDHIHCKFCGRDFQTLAGEMRHMQVEHPLEQNLECPGCGHGPFKRLGALIDHIERGFCTRIDSAYLDQLREEKLEFPRRLEQLTKESIKGNYMKYMPSTRARSSVSGWHVEEKAVSFEMAQEEFPTLADTGGGRNLPTEVTTSDKPKVGGNNGEKKSNARDVIQLPFRPRNAGDRDDTKGAPKLIQLPFRPAFKPGVTTVVADMDCDDPYNPSFNAARFYCSITEKFNCPKRLCMKTFKTAGGLIGHLKSPAHGNKTYRCPFCLKIFKTLAGITSHAEARGSKCRIQDTAHYETFMDQLTAGLVDIERTRYQDGSILFKTSEQMKQRLRGEATEEKTKYQTDYEPQTIHW